MRIAGFGSAHIFGTAVVISLLTFSPPPASTQTTVSTVGPCGSLATIQEAIDLALVGEVTEIRVQGNSTYHENLVVHSSFSSGEVRITGGWDCAFETIDHDPSVTSIDADENGPVVEVNLAGGLFSLYGMTLKNGYAEKGSGIDIQPFGGATVILENLIVENNTSRSSGMATGGGINANLDGWESLDIRDVIVRNNQAISTGSAAVYGGGISVTGAQDSHILVKHCTVAKNRLQSGSGNLLGGGIYVSTTDDCQALVEDCSVSLNTASGSLVLATGAFLNAKGRSILVFERTMVALNSVIEGTDGPQVRAIGEDRSSMWIRDSGFVRGDFRGLEATSIDGSEMYLTNLTIANHSGAGLFLAQGSPASMTLYNSIVFDNGANLLTTGFIDSDFNLIGVNPLFVDAANLDYHVEAGSPAENAGNNDPPGGLGEFDLDGLPRIGEGIVDLGMYEGPGLIFSDSFESGDLSGWTQPRRPEFRVPQYER